MRVAGGGLGVETLLLAGRTTLSTSVLYRNLKAV